MQKGCFKFLSPTALNNSNPCFVAGTLVHTKDGTKPIEEIKVGDWVLTYPDDSVPPTRFREPAEYFYRQVTQVFMHEDEEVCEVIALDLANDVEETITVTLNHPIYVKYKGWLPAGQLKFGTTFVCADFANCLLRKVRKSGVRSRVYNIEVDEFHTYHVGKMGIWVHNKGGELAELGPLRDVTTRQRVFEDTNYVNTNAKDSNAITGKVTEKLGQDAIEAVTNLDFLNSLRNKSNNGPDLWHLDTSQLATTGKAELIVIDIKGSLSIENYLTV